MRWIRFDGKFLIIKEKFDHSIFINAREAAPKYSFRDMFNTSKIPDASSVGLQSIAVPGELAGYWRMFQYYGSGNVSWRRLFRDAIYLARYGFEVHQHLYDALRVFRDKIAVTKYLRKVFFNPKTGDIYRIGEVMKQEALAKTLEYLSHCHNPHRCFYHNLSKKILNDLYYRNDFPDQTPILVQEDFSRYSVIEESAYRTTVDRFQLHTANLPGYEDDVSNKFDQGFIF